MERLPDHVKGLLITGGGILVLTPDSLLVRLISADAWTLLWWREVLMAVGLAVGLLAVYRGKTASAFRAVGRSGCFIAFIFAGSSISFILALTYTSVANTLVIVSAAPLFSAIFARVFLAETVPRRTWGAILLSLVGIGLLVSDSLGPRRRPSRLSLRRQPAGSGYRQTTSLFPGSFPRVPGPRGPGRGVMSSFHESQPCWFASASPPASKATNRTSQKRNLPARRQKERRGRSSDLSIRNVASVSLGFGLFNWDISIQLSLP